MAQPALSLITQAPRAPRREAPRDDELRLDDLVGRLCELCGDRAAAQLTSAFGLVLAAQRSGEPTAWVMARDTTFYPPDLSGSGVDLGALVVVRAPTLADVPRAAEHLLRSGAFGLLVCDLFGAGRSAHIPMPLLSRLSSLSRKHLSAMLFLTHKGEDTPSLGSLISLRAEARRVRTDDGRFDVDVRIVKDKRRAPGWGYRETCRGPMGVR